MRLSPFTWILLIAVGVCLIGSIAFTSYSYSFLEYVISDQVRSEFEGRLALAVHGKAQIGSITCDLHGVIKLLDVELDPKAKTLKEPKVILKIREITIPWKWSDILSTNRLKITTLKMKEVNLIVLTRDPEGKDADSPGLLPNLLPIGSVAPDGAIQPPGSSFGWLLQPNQITFTEGKITLKDFKGKTWAEVTNVTGKSELPGPSMSFDCSAERLSFLNSPITLKNIHFPISIDSMESCEVKTWTADAPFGPISGSMQVQDKSPLFSVHGSGDSYNKFVGLLGFGPGIIDEPSAGPLSFDSQWKGFESGHIIGSGTLKVSDSHFAKIPTIFQTLSQLSPKLDPVSGTASFAAKIDIVEPFLAQASLMNFHVQMGLPDYTEQKIVKTPGKHHSVTETKTESPSPQVLVSDGSANMDLFRPLFIGNFLTPVSASVAARLNSITKAKPAIVDKWFVQLTTSGKLDTLTLTTVPPPAPAVSATPPKPTPPPEQTTPTHRRKRH